MDPQRLRKQIGTNLARLRRERGLTQEELAGRCGLEVTTVASLERARRLPSVPSLVMLAEVLGVTPNEILETAAAARRSARQERLYELLQLLGKRKASEIELVTDLAKRVLKRTGG